MFVGAISYLISRHGERHPSSLAGRVCAMPREVRLLFCTRCARLFAYGGLSVVLFRHLELAGLSPATVGSLLTAIVVGDVVMSLALTTRADRYGRRRTLIVGALLMAASGVVFSVSDNVPALFVAGTLGVVSASGGEIGPFLAIEQAALLDAAGDSVSTAGLFGAYNAAGSVAQALGAAMCGAGVVALQSAWGWSTAASLRAVFCAYAAVGCGMAGAYVAMGPVVEPPAARASAALTSTTAASTIVAAAATTTTSAEAGVVPPASPIPPSPPTPLPPSVAVARFSPSSPTFLGLQSHASRRVVAKLSLLFVLDAHAGGLVMQSWLALWFLTRWGLSEALVGQLLMGANICGAISSLASGVLVPRFGAVNVAVASHFPSSILLMAVPFAPSASIAAALLLARFCISQIDVPARQAFLASVVSPEERSAAGGIANVMRSLGLAASPLVLAGLSGHDTLSAPFFIAGALSCVYDTLLFFSYHLQWLGGNGGAGVDGGSRRSLKSASALESQSPAADEDDVELDTVALVTLAPSPGASPRAAPTSS